MGWLALLAEAVREVGDAGEFGEKAVEEGAVIRWHFACNQVDEMSGDY